MTQARSGAARRLVVGAELAELGRLAEWAEEFAQLAGLPANLLFAIQLCIEEAVANIIMYSGVREARRKVTVELVQADDHVLATIEDRGRCFDPTATPPHRMPASVQQAPVGQLGIHLMRAFATDMRYERRDGCNRLTLTFNPARAA